MLLERGCKSSQGGRFTPEYPIIAWVTQTVSPWVVMVSTPASVGTAAGACQGLLPG